MRYSNYFSAALVCGIFAWVLGSMGLGHAGENQPTDKTNKPPKAPPWDDTKVDGGWGFGRGKPPFLHYGGPHSIAYAPEGNRIAAAASDNRIHIWDIGTAKEVVTMPEFEESLDCLAYSPDGRFLATAGAGVEIWDVREGKLLRRLWEGKETEVVFALAWIDNGKGLVAASFDNTIRIWDTTTGKLERSLPAPPGDDWDNFRDPIAFHADSKVYANGSAKAVRVFDLTTGQLKEQCGHHRDVLALSFSPDGRYLTTVGQNGRIRVWDRKDKKACYYCGPHPGAMSIAYSKNGASFATASGVDGKVRVWRAQSGELLHTFGAPPGDKCGLDCVRFSPSGKQLAVCAPRVIWFWDLETGKMLHKER